MTVKGHIKEAAGYVEEETGEVLKDKEMADAGRKLREEGRREDKKSPIPTPPGAGHKSDDK